MNEATCRGAQSSWLGSLLANQHDCGLGVRLLIKHISWYRLQSFPQAKGLATVFILIFCCTPECQCLLWWRFIHISVSWVLCLVPWLLQLLLRKHPLIYCLWWTRRLAFLDPTGLWQLWRLFLTGYHPQGTAQTADSDICPSISVKDASCLFACLGALACGGRLKVWHTFSGLLICSQGT